MRPTVDVIIPTRNRLELTLEAVASVRAQTFADWHLVVVDDASDDGKDATLAELLSDDPRISVVRRKVRGGSSIARHTGVEAGCAPLIATLDSDDLWLPNKLKRQIDMALSQPNGEAAGVVLCWHDYVRANGILRGRIHRPRLDGRSNPLPSYNMSTPLVRRDVLDASGGFELPGAPWLRTAEHVDLYLRLGLHATVSVVPELLVFCRHHSGERNSDVQGTRAAADEAAIIVERLHHELAEQPRQSAWLLSWVGARYLVAGERRQGLGYLRAGCFAADVSTAGRIIRRYGPFSLKQLSRCRGR